MKKYNDPEIMKLKDRIQEEFVLVKDLQGRADVESAMMNVDNLIDYFLKKEEKGKMGRRG